MKLVFDQSAPVHLVGVSWAWHTHRTNKWKFSCLILDGQYRQYGTFTQLQTVNKVSEFKDMYRLSRQLQTDNTTAVAASWYSCIWLRNIEETFVLFCSVRWLLSAWLKDGTMAMACLSVKGHSKIGPVNLTTPWQSNVDFILLGLQRDSPWIGFLFIPFRQIFGFTQSLSEVNSPAISHLFREITLGWSRGGHRLNVQMYKKCWM